MNEQFLKNIQVVKSAIAERKLVVFAGSGISVDSGVPVWSDLIAELKKDIEVPPSETDFIRIAQLYYNERNPKDFIDRVREVLRHKATRYNELHRQLFDLGPEHIISTNVDDLFEQVIKTKAFPYSVIKKETDFPYAHNTRLLVKMHGDLDEGNIVLKEDDYLEYANTHPLTESFVKGIFATKVVLFAGYSFTDINLKMLLQSVRNILRTDSQQAYLLSVEDNFHPAQRQYLKNKGITVIHYADAGDLLAQFSSEEQLSEKGNRLLKLIKFINTFNEFRHQVHNDNPLVQMEKSLHRFGHCRSLPPKFLGNLYPFHVREGFIHNYHHYTLGSNNKEINRFFFEHIKPETLEVNDAFLQQYNIDPSEKNTYDQRLRSVVTIFNASGIFFFGKTGDPLNVFDYPKDFKDRVKLQAPPRHCDCLSCRFNEFNILGMLRGLAVYDITETSALSDDMLFAYAHYKACNYALSVRLFEEIGNKAWQLGEYLTYFISQHNVKIMRNLVSWDVEESDDKTKKKLHSMMGRVDLDKLMFQVPKLNDDVYRLMKIIGYSEVLISADRKISDAFDEILKVYKGFQRGSVYTGPYYPRQVTSSLYEVFVFFSFNSIVEDDYTEYQSVFQRGIKALLICNAIDEEYHGRFTKVDRWLVRFILLYADTSELRDLLRDYDIKELGIEDGEADLIFMYLNTLFTSFVEIRTFLGREAKLQKEMTKQLTNWLFEQRLLKCLQNAFLLFSVVSIPEQYMPSLMRNLLDFLAVETVLVPFSFREFNGFLKQLIVHASDKEISELLTIAPKKLFMLESKHFFGVIGQELSNRPDRFGQMDILQDIIDASLNDKKDRSDLSFMYLSIGCTKAGQELIQAAVRNNLRANFDEGKYINACLADIIDAAEFEHELVKVIEPRIPKEFRLEGKRHFYSDLTIANFLILIYHKRLFHDHWSWTDAARLPLYMRFYLDPFSFDYDQFEVSWLLPLERYDLLAPLSPVTAIKSALEKSLAVQYDKTYSEIYARHFLATTSSRGIN